MGVYSDMARKRSRTGWGGKVTGVHHLAGFVDGGPKWDAGDPVVPGHVLAPKCYRKGEGFSVDQGENLFQITFNYQYHFPVGTGFLDSTQHGVYTVTGFAVQGGENQQYLATGKMF